MTLAVQGRERYVSATIWPTPCLDEMLFEMVASALQAASVAAIPEGLFLADDVKIYKPAKEIYHDLLSKLNADRGDGAQDGYTGEDVWLVSG